MEDKIKEIEAKNRKNNTKLFYKNVEENNKVYKGKVKGIQTKEGRVTELEQEYNQIWKEYFENLLTDCEIQTLSENELEQNVEDTTEEVEDPTRAEIEDIINKSRNGKSSGKDGIRMDEGQKLKKNYAS